MRFFCYRQGMFLVVPMVKAFVDVLSNSPRPIIQQSPPDMRSGLSEILADEVAKMRRLKRPPARGSIRGIIAPEVCEMVGSVAAPHESAPPEKSLVDNYEALMTGSPEEWERLVMLLRTPPCEVRPIPREVLSALVECYSPSRMPMWASWVPIL